MGKKVIIDREGNWYCTGEPNIHKAGTQTNPNGSHSYFRCKFKKLKDGAFAAVHDKGNNINIKYLMKEDIRGIRLF